MGDVLGYYIGVRMTEDEIEALIRSYTDDGWHSVEAIGRCVFVSDSGRWLHMYDIGVSQMSVVDLDWLARIGPGRVDGGTD